MEIMGILNPIKICPKKMSRPYPRHISHIYVRITSFGAVTFEYSISVTELKYKLGFICYHVEDMMRYLRNCHVASVPLNVSTPQSSQ